MKMRPDAIWRTAPVRGAAWMTCAAAAFVLMSWSIRALAPITASEIVFFRSLFGLVLILPTVNVPLRQLVRPRWPKLYLLRGCFSYLAMLSWFYPLQVLVLADAVALQFTLPLFTILFAIVVFREQVGVRRWTATAIGFAGALLIIRPGFVEVDIGMVLVLVSAALYASANMVVKKLSGIENPGVIVFYLHAVTLPLALAGAVPYWIWPTWTDVPWIAVLAVSATAAHYCFTRSMRASEVSIVMPFDYLRLPMIALVGYFAYDQSAQVWTWLGAAVICGASLYILKREAEIAQARDRAADQRPMIET
ncbi:MAG: EamA family transporter [Alphaproteobacteria bacterium]|nr:EamA family transporter [Alphaproteobacteria bacterium]